MNKSRYFEKRVRIDKGLLRKIVYEIKHSNKHKWRDLSKILGVGKHTICHDWIKTENTIPWSVFRKIISLHPKEDINQLKFEIINDPFWGQRINKKTKEFRLPNENTLEFAEFYGIMLGDGCIYSNLSGFCISGDKILDKDYYENYLYNLIFKLFNAKPKINYSKSSRSVRIWLYSRPVSEFLVSLGFPKGEKLKHNIKIPEFILSKKDLTAACIRGLVDTDGSFCAHPHSKVMIHISITSNSLIDSAHKGLIKLGIKSGKYNKGIVFYGKDKINQYANAIGFSNKKNLVKYSKFLETGKAPTSKETETFLRDENLK